MVMRRTYITSRLPYGVVLTDFIMIPMDIKKGVSRELPLPTLCGVLYSRQLGVKLGYLCLKVVNDLIVTLGLIG